MDKLTPKQMDVLKAMLMSSPFGTTPTVIGEKCRKQHDAASSWACGALKVLTRDGYTRRVVEGGCRIIYRLTPAGLAKIKEVENS